MESARRHDAAFAPVITRSRLSLPGRREGKVRDTYELPGDRLLIVATDRVSAFDVVMPTAIPDKGRLLTDMSTFWLRFIERHGLARTHLLSTDADEIPASAFARPDERADYKGRVTIARRCRVIPVECVARGYLEGSGWKDYQSTGSVCGIPLPPGLRQCDRLPEPIFTPATKAPRGQHDQNISFDTACGLVGHTVMEHLRHATLSIYRAASEHAQARGIIIADTKFEFGFDFGLGPDAAEPILIDEALTPDSSRFWPADDYQSGRAQHSFDKQPLREYLEGLVSRKLWNKRDPGPELPIDVVMDTMARYRRARDLLLA